MWTLRLPEQSYSPTICVCTVLSTEGEGRAEIKSPLENANWLCWFVFFFSLPWFHVFPSYFPHCLSLEDIFCNWSPHQPTLMLCPKGKGITYLPRQSFSGFPDTFSACHLFTGKCLQGRSLLCCRLYCAFCWYLSNNKVVFN